MSADADALLGSPPPIDAITRAEFEDDFLHNPHFASHARKRAKHGLQSSRLRSVHWRLFLCLLDAQDVGSWSGQLDVERRAYDELLRKYKVTPSPHEEQQKQHDDRASSSGSSSNPQPEPLPLPLPTVISPLGHSAGPSSSSSSSSSISSSASSGPPTGSDLKIHNPLSTASSSPWHHYFHTSSLSSVITQDLSRTYPESAFFQHGVVQELMLNVLLVWAKLNPQYEYRQGMNELLAPLVLTVFRDGRSSGANDGVLGALLDRHWAEHDVFALFRQLMKTMAPFFAKLQDNRPLTHSAASLTSVSRVSAAVDDLVLLPPPPPTTQSTILLKCHHIHHTLLAALDPALYKHLNAQDVQPQLYGLRWYRLLFAREFHVSDVCNLWDLIFSQRAEQQGGGGGGGFVLADYVCVAMLYYVRRELLGGDNTSCLRRLLRFPPVEDMRVLCDRALFFSTPQMQKSTAAAGSSSGADLASSVAKHHADMQRFIAEYGQELENSYLDGPLGPLRRGSQASAALLQEGVSRVEALVRKGKAAATAAGAAGGASANGHHAAITHSASHSSLSSQSAASAAPSSSSSSSSSPSSAESLAYYRAVQHEMGAKLHDVILVLNKEWERLHKGQTAAPAVGPQHQGDEEEEAAQAEPHSVDNGANISVEMDEQQLSRGAACVDMQLLSNSLADLKHVADVLLGRLVYTPQQQKRQDDDDAAPAPRATSHPQSQQQQPPQQQQQQQQQALQTAPPPARSGSPLSLPPTLAAALPSSPLAAGSASSPMFFAPKSIEDPKERLQRLLTEKEREAQRARPTASDALSIHIPPSSSPPAGLLPVAPVSSLQSAHFLPVRHSASVHSASSPSSAGDGGLMSPLSAPAQRQSPQAAAGPTPGLSAGPYCICSLAVRRCSLRRLQAVAALVTAGRREEERVRRLTDSVTLPAKNGCA